MLRTSFKISGMDCPSEERLIRMKLENLPEIHGLSFDIPQRLLTVIHTANPDTVFQWLEDLHLGTTLLESSMADDFPLPEPTGNEKMLLWKVLVINFFFFLLEISTGFFSRSMGLVADGLDMLADSIVYGLALWAVAGTVTRKKNVAKAAGYFQFALALAGLLEVFRRFIQPERVPAFQTMMVISFLALIGNATCLYLLQKSRSREAHLQASMIFTSNDVLVNLGVILAGGLVFLTHSKYPDLFVGSIVFIIVCLGALKILELAKH
jgi:Co/Zn/Cd efflux system component